MTKVPPKKFSVEKALSMENLSSGTRWKVLISDKFGRSFRKLKSDGTKSSIMKYLLKLSGGWRPNIGEDSSQIITEFKVNNGLGIVCTNDIVKDECSTYIQVLKVWDILPLMEIPELVKPLHSIVGMYNDGFKNRCKEKCFEGNLLVPKSWMSSYDEVSNNELDCAGSSTDGTSYVEALKVDESLLHTKFYPLSSAAVMSQLLSECNAGELALSFQLANQELEITQFNKSAFIAGRSGTGKTTILVKKLFQREEQHRGQTTPLRQLFVTFSPKLCHAVKQQITQLDRIAHGGKFTAENSLMDDMEDIPNSFVKIPDGSYPLVITFRRFLLMMDKSLGVSFFEKLNYERSVSNPKTGNLRSEVEEVNYARFSKYYWPQCSEQKRKNLDSDIVFTQIISQIKGGLQAGEEPHDVKLSKENYISLSKGRDSTLDFEQREAIYGIFERYEKRKMGRGEFDMADLVIDLHHRLLTENFEGDKMNYVYIDDVQDLSMREISLLKNVCENGDEGFIFSGDTAQTIARGIDYTLQDIRNLFYSEFILKSKSAKPVRRTEMEERVPIFKLTQNFRTHAGVLRLGQSVIDLLYHFFPLSIEEMKPETSPLYIEAPVLLETSENEKATVTIFGNCINAGDKLVGFGSEMVILVRDEDTRMEIFDFVGKKALVLTLEECQGLEFQDVILYNFFSTSPEKTPWRLVGRYMTERNMMPASSSQAFPEFIPTKHRSLCSELKQLYVAISRTKQRLWICDSINDLSKPMFDYWKKLSLVEVKEVHHSLTQTMKIPSSPEECGSWGHKLLDKEYYEMAAMCFERAGETETNLKKKADFAKLNKDAEIGSDVIRESAKTLYSGNRAKEKAECCALGEYERAGCVGSEEVLKELENKKQEESSDNVVVHGTDAVVHGTDAGGTDEPIEVQYDDVTHNVETMEPNIPMSSQEDELLNEKWNGVMIASKFAYYLKPAALRYPEVFTSLCGLHYLIKRSVFECIGRVLQIFYGLVRGICEGTSFFLEETLLSEAKELVDYLKVVSVDVDWLEEKLRIAEKTSTLGRLQGEMKTTLDEYNRIQECCSEIDRKVNTLMEERTNYGAQSKTTLDKYGRLEECHSEIAREVKTLIDLEFEYL